MIKRNGYTKRTSPGQCGYAMLSIIAVLGIAATAVVVTSLSATAVHNEQSRKTGSALALAKQALIAYAASSNSRPGSLPCPDADNDGLSDPSGPGACTRLIGRLPWQTLGLPDLRDASSERLWYALSQQFNDAGNVINSNTAGELNVTGTLSADRAAAIVFAPGAPVNGQLRGAAQSFSVSQYMEGYTATTPPSFSTSEAGSSYNDQLIVISAIDIFLVVERRVAKEVQNALKSYYTATSTLPWYAAACSGSDATLNCPAASPTPPTPAAGLPAVGTPGYIPTDLLSVNFPIPSWFSANNWNRVVTYRVDSDCAAAPGLSTCGTAFAGFTVDTSSGILIGFTGGGANAGTKAVLSFAGVNTLYPNYQTTVLNAALQLQ